MMSIAKFSVNNRVLVNLFMMLILIGGIFAYTTMHREVFPLFTLKLVAISTVYPDVSPREMEELVTAPIENVVAELDGVKEVRSSSTEGLSIIVLELEQDVAEPYRVVQDIETAIDTIENFPDDAEDPQVEEITAEFPVIDVAVAGEAPEEVLREVAKDLKDDLERIAGVSSVTPSGMREREIWVEVNPDRLYQKQIPLDAVIVQLQRKNVNVPAGALQTQRGEVILRTSGKIGEAADLLGVVIRSDPQGRHVYLRDIGTARETFEEPRTFGRVNGHRSINLHIVKKKTGDTIDIVQQVKTLTESMRPNLPPGVKLYLLRDGSIWIKNRLRTMYKTGLWGLILVLILLNLFLDPRISLMTAWGLPLAIAGGFLIVYIFGGSVNMLTLFSVILVLGMLVDDAIIVTENSYRYMQRGLSPKEAVIRGTNEVMLPVIAAITTTICAFLPLLLTSGIMGEFLRIIPIVAASTLIASLLEALIILPSHLADVCRPPAEADYRTSWWFRKCRRGYGRVLCLTVRFRYIALALILVVTIFTGVLASTMRFVFFESEDIIVFSVKVTAPPDSQLEETERIVAQVEKAALAFPPDQVDSVIGNVGLVETQERPEFGPQVGQVIVDLGDLEQRVRPGREILQEMREEVKKVVGAESIEFEEIQGGPPLGRALSVRIRGEEYAVLQQIGEEIKDFLRGIEGVHDISDSFLPGKEEVRVAIDEAKAAFHGLTVDTIGRAVRTAMKGTEISSIQRADEEIDILVKYQPAYRRTIADITSLRIGNGGGQLIPFSNFAKIIRTPGYARLDRWDQKRIITVFADVDSEVITSTEANARVREEFRDVSERYPGYSLYFGGEAEDTRESLQSLFQAFIIAFLAIYLILGGVFKSFLQPFVVMGALPFSIIGVVLGFFLIGEPLSFMALFGVIALCGIVVNDSLILVDFINQSRARGIPTVVAVVKSAKVRFRPVILTTVTTVGGLLPLALTSTGQAAFLAPMAMAIVWGLAFATVLTLLVVPSFYLIAYDLIRGMKRLVGLRL